MRSLRSHLQALLPGSAATAVLVLVASGCASYTSRTAGALRDFQEGRLTSSMEGFRSEKKTGSRFLSGAEAGTVAWTAGDWDAAIAAFDDAVAAADDLEQRGLLGAEKLAEGLSSWALNDTTQAYQGEGFERVYTHVFLALAYLAKGQLDGVYVEARRANRLLETEEELYERSYRAGGAGHFVSALAYELLGEFDQAYIDYARMAEKEVGLGLAGPALVRMAREQQRDDDLPRWLERFGEPLERPADAANVVLIAAVGLAPYKVEGSLLIPTRDGLIPFAVPAYRERSQPVQELRLDERVSGVGVLTEVLERVDEIAPENLADRLAWTTTKSVARGILKRELTKSLEKEHGLGGRVVGDLFAAITERADLRSWTTLPASFQAARLFVPPGEVDLVLEAVGGAAVELGAYALEPGETLIVLARTLGRRVYAYPIGGRPLAPAERSAAPLFSLVDETTRTAATAAGVSR